MKTKRARVTRSGIIHFAAYCRDCEWINYARNALGTAAIHFEKTGHTVDVEMMTAVTYCTPQESDRINERIGRKPT